MPWREKSPMQERIRSVRDCRSGPCFNCYLLFEEEYAMLPEDTEVRIQLLLSPWNRSLFSFDPSQILEQLRVPILVATGDLRVGGPKECLMLAGDTSRMGAEIVSSWLRIRFVE